MRSVVRFQNDFANLLDATKRGAEFLYELPSMSSLDYQRTVFGYHGCDQSVLERVLSGNEFRPSDNDYDWLGRGIYFWEYGPARAVQWAREEQERKPDKVTNPSSVGAVIHLGQCFDLLDVRYTSCLKDAFPSFVYAQGESDEPMPTNAGARNRAGDLLLRRLDCAVLNWAIVALEKELGYSFQTVRGVFVEGDAAFPGSCIMEKSHIQVSVRDARSIVGVFRPRA